MQKRGNKNAYKKICLRHPTTKLLAKLHKYDEISSPIWMHFKSTLKQNPLPPLSMLVDCFGLPHAGQRYRWQHWSWGEGERGNQDEFRCVFQHAIFSSKLRIWKSFANLFCRWVSEKHIFLKLLVFVFKGILWPNLDSIGDSKIIYDNNLICDVITLALYDVTGDSTCQNGKCIDNCQNVLKIVY